MLSKIDLRDFFEINQGLYNEPAVHPRQVLAGILADHFDERANQAERQRTNEKRE